MRLPRFTNLFRRYLGSFVLILAITILIASVVHISSLRTIESGVIENRVILMERNTAVIDDYLSQLKEISRQIRYNTRLMSYLYKDRLQAGSRDVYDLITTHKNLASYTIASPFRESFFIFYQRSELILSRPAINYGFDFHYENFLNLPGMDAASWYAFLFDSRHAGSFLSARPVSLNLNEPLSMIPYVETILSPEMKSNAVIVILIEEPEIRRFLNQVLGDSPGLAAIIDKDGEIISSVHRGAFPLSVDDIVSIEITGEPYRKYHVNGMNVRIAEVRSGFIDWTYVTAIPDRILMENAVRIRNIMIAIAAIAVGVGIILSYLLAYWNTKPLQEVLSSFRGVLRQDNMDAYQLLRSNVQHMMENNNELNRMIARQQRALTFSFLSLLIHGDFSSEQDIEEMISYSTFRLKHVNHVVCVIRISHGDQSAVEPTEGRPIDGRSDGGSIRELELSRVIIEDALRNYVAGQGEWLFLRPAEIVVLFGLEQEDEVVCKREIDQIIDSLQDVLHHQYRVRTIAGIGIFARRLIDVHRSFNTAVQAANSLVGSNRRKVWFDETRSKRRIYDYPIEVETRLLGFARAGNLQEIERILDEIRRSNEVEHPHEIMAMRNLVRAIMGTVYRLIEERSEFESVLADLPSSHELSEGSLNELFEELWAVFRKICRIAQTGKRSHNRVLIERILEYVDIHYLDHNLSVAQLAAEFNLSETYFSSFFKEQTGRLFSSYLESKRIQHACNLLERRNGKTLEDVARAVGYTNTRTFRRAFKKLKGITPGQFR